MSEVTVTAVQPVLGLREGDTVTIERTERVARHIKEGHLRVVDGSVETTDVGTTSDHPDPIPVDQVGGEGTASSEDTKPPSRAKKPTTKLATGFVSSRKE
ncbi:hypothetical protein [Gordonia sp. (in: high G+C Gram-positive bacteria)]|uniref:hypothetical protein n=1 Tax=Gordonia sp. (in: high G+C Gram-positive bacteria) TaxID=84139 RepID=UPI003340E40E